MDSVNSEGCVQLTGGELGDRILHLRRAGHDKAITPKPSFCIPRACGPGNTLDIRSTPLPCPVLTLADRFISNGLLQVDRISETTYRAD
jgi:hypothetical protein